MQVTTYGTRGSTAVARPDTVWYGGNTTCLRIKSDCLPSDTALVIDSGTGFVPLCDDLATEPIGKLLLLWTHYHHDHTIGLPLGQAVYRNDIHFSCYGPIEKEIGPREVLSYLMASPFFPVSFVAVAQRFSTFGITEPTDQIIAVHAKGGFISLRLDFFREAETSPTRQLSFPGGHFPVDECLIIRMVYTTHPERTISYRFEERPTGRCFVFLTDHENTAGLPQSLLRHVAGANLLIADSQYPEKDYLAKAGWGHGTPEYCVRLAQTAKAQRLGLTHHDPQDSKAAIEQKVADALAANTLPDSQLIKEIFACADGRTYEA